MKLILFFLLLLFAFPVLAQEQSESQSPAPLKGIFSWVHPVVFADGTPMTPDGISASRVYCGDSPEVLSFVTEVDVSVTEIELSSYDLGGDGIKYCAASSVGSTDERLEGELSDPDGFIKIAGAYYEWGNVAPGKSRNAVVR